MNEQQSNEPNNSNESASPNESVMLNNQHADSYDHDSTTREIINEDRKMGVVDRIVNLFVSPGALMHNIRLFPVIGAAYLVSVIIGCVAYLVLAVPATEISTREMSNISIERYGIDLFGAGQNIDVYGDNIGNNMETAMIVTNVMSAILLPFILCFFSALGLLILTKILRGSATLGQYFSMSMHLYIISAIAIAVGYASIIFTGRILDVTSLAALFMPNGNITMISFNILNSITIFGIWSTVLTFIGVKVINEFSAAKAAIITFIYFVVTVAIAVGILSSTFLIMDMTFGV